jgi:hypothetical protein
MSTRKFDGVIQEDVVGRTNGVPELTLGALREVDLDLAVDDVLDLESFRCLDAEEFHDLTGVDVHVVPFLDYD